MVTRDQLLGNWDILNDLREPLSGVITFTPEGVWRRVRLAHDVRDDIVLGILGKGKWGRCELKDEDSRPWLILAVHGYEGGEPVDYVMSKFLKVIFPPYWLFKLPGVLNDRHRILQVGATELKVQKLDDGYRPGNIEYWCRRRHPC